MGEISEHWRDVEAHQKRQQSAHPPRRPCYDWIVVSGHCHYAKNRSSFTDYRPIQATAQGIPVIGIGTVRLQVLRSPGAPDTNTLLLENVLHTPNAVCNGFKSQLLRGHETWTSDLVQGLDRSTGQPLWYGVEFCGLWRLALAGNPQGESVLEEMTSDGSGLSLSLYLRDEEMASLQAYVTENS